MVNRQNLFEEKMDEYLKIAQSRDYDLQDLLNDFFELSVVESPEYKLKLESINVNNIICDVIIDFYEKLTINKINCELENNIFTITCKFKLSK